jgi:hypothetical protein
MRSCAPRRGPDHSRSPSAPKRPIAPRTARTGTAQAGPDGIPPCDAPGTPSRNPDSLPPLMHARAEPPSATHATRQRGSIPNVEAMHAARIPSWWDTWDTQTRDKPCCRGHACQPPLVPVRHMRHDEGGPMRVVSDHACIIDRPRRNTWDTQMRGDLCRRSHACRLPLISMGRMAPDERGSSRIHEGMRSTANPIRGTLGTPKWGWRRHHSHACQLPFIRVERDSHRRIARLPLCVDACLATRSPVTSRAVR